MYTKDNLATLTVDALAEIVLTIQAENQAAVNEHGLTVTINTELSKQIEDLQKNPVRSIAGADNAISTETFEVDGVKAGFKKRAIDHKGSIITAVEVLASEALQRELVNLKSGLLKFLA